MRTKALVKNIEWAARPIVLPTRAPALVLYRCKGRARGPRCFACSSSSLESLQPEGLSGGGGGGVGGGWWVGGGGVGGGGWQLHLEIRPAPSWSCSAAWPSSLPRRVGAHPRVFFGRAHCAASPVAAAPSDGSSSPLRCCCRRGDSSFPRLYLGKKRLTSHRLGLSDPRYGSYRSLRPSSCCSSRSC
jgi:hypothetical protein